MKVNDKVVCIRDNWNKNPFYATESIPQKDKTYVIYGFNYLDNILGLQLVGCKSINSNGLDVGWCSTAFRKLEDVQQENKLKREIEELKLKSIDNLFKQLTDNKKDNQEDKLKQNDN